MAYWTKMTEILETYRETHKSIFRHRSEIGKEELSKFLIGLGGALHDKEIEITKLLPVTGKKKVHIIPTDPIALKFLYAKENHKLEIHMELEWIPRSTCSRGHAFSIS